MVTPAGSCQEATAPTPLAAATRVSSKVRPTLKTKAKAKPAKHAKRAAPGGEGIELAEEQGNHQRGLEGADAAARLVNADHSGADLDDIAVLDGGHPEAGQATRRSSRLLSRISDWVTKFSSPEGQGTATRKKRMGKVKRDA